MHTKNLAKLAARDAQIAIETAKAHALVLAQTLAQELLDITSDYKYILATTIACGVTITSTKDNNKETVALTSTQRVRTLTAKQADAKKLRKEQEEEKARWKVGKRGSRKGRRGGRNSKAQRQARRVLELLNRYKAELTQRPSQSQLMY